MRTITLAIFISFVFCSLGYTQPNVLDFDTKYYDAVDEWIAFPVSEADSTYPYGFVYVDQQAGFTFHYQSTFKIIDGELVSQPEDSSEIQKVRLQPRMKPISILNDTQRKELNLPAEPDWLNIYKKDKNTVSYLQRIGYHYNHAGASEKALKYLEKAYTIEPHYEGVEFELAFAYNATQQYEKAIKILDQAIQNNPENDYFYRELGFAYINLDKISKAAEVYLKDINLSDNNTVKSEMSVNMAQVYFQRKDKEAFNKWAALTRKFANKGSQYLRYINYFEKNWNNQ